MVLQRQEGSDSLRYPASDRRHIRRAGREVGPDFQDWDLKVHKGWTSPDSQPVFCNTEEACRVWAGWIQKDRRL